MFRRLSTKLGDVLSIVDDTPVLGKLSTNLWILEPPNLGDLRWGSVESGKDRLAHRAVLLVAFRVSPGIPQETDVHG